MKIFSCAISFVLYAVFSVASPSNVSTDAAPTREDIDSEYIVVLQPNQTIERHFADIEPNDSIVLNHLDLINAYHGRLHAQDLQAIQSDPGVKNIVQAQGVHVDVPTPSVNKTSSSPARRWIMPKQDAPWWHLAMLSSWDILKITLDSQGIFRYWQTNDGQLPGYGVRVYVLDSGANVVSALPNIVDFPKTYNGLGHRDDKGHGTGVMSLIGGTYHLGGAIGLATSTSNAVLSQTRAAV